MTQIANSIFKFFRQFDLFLTTASLRIHNKPAMRSSMLGIFSLMIFSGLIYILATNCLDVINYQHITYQITENIIPSQMAEGEIKMFAISLAFIPTNIFDQSFDFYLNYYVEGKLTQVSKLTLCLPSQWKDLGPNYNSSFYFYAMDMMYCPNITKLYKIKRSSIENNFTSISITLKLCNQSQRSDCNLTGFTDSLGLIHYRRAWLYLLDTVLHPEKQQMIQYRVTIVKAVMSLYNREYTQILLSMYNIETDTSMYPWVSSEVVTGSTFSHAINNQYENYESSTLMTDTFIEMSIYMSHKLINIQRSFGKFDQVISYVGGLFAVIIPGLGWFLLSYNKYRYEIKVAEGAFNFDEQGNKIKERSFHFSSYIKYTVYTWLNAIFCGKFKWRKCLEIDKVRENIIAQMDARALFRRLQKIQDMIVSKIDKNEVPCIMLLEPLSLKNIRKQRLKLDYYDEVIKGEAAVTLEDLLMLQQRQSYSQKKSSSQSSSAKGKQKQKEDSNGNEELESANSFKKLPNFEEQEVNKEIGLNMIIQLRDGYSLVKKTVDFVKAEEEAMRIQLNHEFIEVENYFAKVYSQFNESDKRLIENRVPMTILHRLNRKAKQREKEKQSSVFN